jgi:hypothetical protein
LYCQLFKVFFSEISSVDIYQPLNVSVVRNDMKKMKLIKWTEQVQDHLEWKATVEKAKTIRVVAQKKKKCFCAKSSSHSHRAHYSFSR